MKNETILKKAIEKAEKNGWKKIHLLDPDGGRRWKLHNDWNVEDLEYEQMTTILFDHEFCKAFFGEEIICEDCGDQDCYETSELHPSGGMPTWEYSMRNLASSKDRLGDIEWYLDE